MNDLLAKKCTKEFHNINIFRLPVQSISKNKIKHFETEYKAAVNLLARSCDVSPLMVRRLHSSSKFFSSNKPPNDKDYPDKTNGNDRNNANKNEDNEKNENEDEDKMKSILSKALLWMFAIYMLVVFLSVIITPRAERPEV